MAHLSQRSVGLMMQILEIICIQPDPDTLPLVSKDSLYNGLYEAGVSVEVLAVCVNPYYWRFEILLPHLHNGRFFFEMKLSSTRSPLRRAPIEEEGVQDGDIERGNEVLLKFAELLNEALSGLNDLPPQLHQELLARLSADGFSLVKCKFVPTDSAAVDLPGEISFLKVKLSEAGFPNEKVMLHHFERAEKLFIEPEVGDTSIGQWRSFYEQLIKDIANTTSEKRNDIGNPPGGITNLFEWLKKVGFFTSDEEQAARAVYGFLCAGSHPGIPPEHAAHIALVLTMGFAQALVLKYLDWKGNAFRSFSSP